MMRDGAHLARSALVGMLILGCQSSFSPERPYPLSATIYYVRPLCGLEVKREHGRARIWIPPFESGDRLSPWKTTGLFIHISPADLDALQRYCSRPEETPARLETVLSR